MVIEMQEQGRKYRFKAKVFLFFVMVCVIFLVGEISIRIYAQQTNTVIGSSAMEIQVKTRYQKFTNLSDSFRFEFDKPFYMYDPLLGITNRPNISFAEENVVPFNQTHNAIIVDELVSINSAGLRSLHETNKTKAQDTTRIAIVGDSMTFGDEVKTSFAYSSLLEVMIPKSNVLNFGRNGAGLAYMYLIFKNRTIEYDPDVLIMSLFIDDIARVQKLAFEPFLILVHNKLVVEGTPIPTPEQFLQEYEPPMVESYLVKFLLYTWSLMGSRERAYAHGFLVLDKMLGEMKQQMKNKTFLVTLITDKDFSPNNIEYDKYQKLKQMLQEKSIPFVDGEEIFNEESIKYGSKRVFYNNVHLSPLGNAVFAQAIKEKLSDMKIINKTKPYAAFVVSQKQRHMFFLNESYLPEKKLRSYTISGYYQKTK